MTWDPATRLESNAQGDRPRVAPTAFVHPTAVLIGNVIVRSRVFIGPHAVLRADEPDDYGRVHPVIVGEESNVQDHVVVHALAGSEVHIGPRASLAHAALVHGPAEVGEGCFVGFRSTVFRARLGHGAVVLHHALVEGADVPAERLVPSAAVVRTADDARRLAPVPAEYRDFAVRVARMNVQLARTTPRPGDAAWPAQADEAVVH